VILITDFEVAVLGTGVAGLASAIEVARLGRSVVTLDRMGPGGQVMNAGSLGHVPGLTAEARGSDLIGRLVDQAVERDVALEFGDVSAVAARGSGFEVTSDSGSFSVAGVVVALGARDATLGIPGEDTFHGRGVSYCAQCDGDLFRGGNVAVVGGGDAALEAAAHLASRTARVTILHRGTQFSAADELRAAGVSPGNVSVRWQTEVLSVEGDDRVRSIQVQAKDKNTAEAVSIDGIFLAVGADPQNEPVAALVDLDHDGRIPVDARLSTAVPGLYAAGMCRANSADQIATALGDGVAAARGLHAWLPGRQ
jgi:thioredoxin reductase (NADPH)